MISGQGPEPDWQDLNYLAACRRAAASTGHGAADAQAALDGITAVLAGDLSSFGMDYEMIVDGTSMWYHLEALPLRGNDGVVVTHADITRRMSAEDELGYRAARGSKWKDNNDDKAVVGRTGLYWFGPVGRRGLQIEYALYAQCVNWIAAGQARIKRGEDGRPRVAITDPAYPGCTARSRLCSCQVQ